MTKYTIVPKRSRGFKMNLKDWCSRPTYKNKYPVATDLLYRANGSQSLSQRSAFAMIEDLTDRGDRIIELSIAGRHTHTFRVSTPMDALLKICDLAIKYGATRYRHDGKKSSDQYEVFVR